MKVFAAAFGELQARRGELVRASSGKVEYQGHAMMKGFSMRNLVPVATALAFGVMATSADLVLESGSASKADSLSWLNKSKLAK